MDNSHSNAGSSRGDDFKAGGATSSQSIARVQALNEANDAVDMLEAQVMDDNEEDIGVIEDHIDELVAQIDGMEEKVGNLDGRKEVICKLLERRDPHSFSDEDYETALGDAQEAIKELGEAADKARGALLNIQNCVK